MARVAPGELRRFNAEPVRTVTVTRDLPYGGSRDPEQRLDVLVPEGSAPGDPLPVYVYFHGGGWTAGDKAPLTKYCASQADAGMIVVNANYRRADHRARSGHQMQDMLTDASAVLGWVRRSIADFGGDPDRVVVGGDSAGGQIAALTTAIQRSPVLAEHYEIDPFEGPVIKGLVQHCSVADFRIVFERGFIMGLDFVRMLLPDRARGLTRSRLIDAAHFLSPVEWLDASAPPTLVTSSARDFLYRANLNLAARLREHGTDVDSLFLGREAVRARHTWQQDASLPESQLVYRRLQEFVGRVAAPGLSAA
ncbi:alpha/beta hydrolase [Amnibacterium flavum]|uniref:Alpha/beta hydrolase n=2 Tax=Amnibacterium flavum TaxID=2173173 RepID=A0A2V1HPN7_9MICO|nr:alpha/beta hydrolase [Amnibacterium flavum]